ncbi:MAG: efflux RND transporter periplasmic adaptor subunit [Elusimicrobiota bacterium]
MKVILKTLGIFFVCGVLLGLNFYRDIKNTSTKMKWFTVEQKNLYRGVASPGIIEALNISVIKSQVDEFVQKKWVNEGDPVKKGQVLMELTQDKIRIDYDQSQLNYNNTINEYKKALREFTIQKKLFMSKAVAKAQVEEAERNVERSKSSRDISAQQFKLVEEKLKSTTVLSPIDGIVLKDHTKPDIPITSGKELFTIGDVSQFIVRTKIDELDMNQIKLGLPTAIQVDAFPDKKIEGVVKSIATQAEREAFAKLEVLIDIVDDGGVQLKHNLSVKTIIRSEEIPNAIGIPVPAIIRKKGNQGWVLVKNTWNLIQEKTVELGSPAGELIEIKSGLKSGDEVGIPSIGEADLK